ncbi:MAG TPA: FAD-binding protein [Clostridia bacterium]
MYDIVIIGAGPAGCTLARFLDKSYKVLLLDKRDVTNDEYPGIHKCCGGLLAPDAQNMLGRMGMPVPVSILVDPQLFLVRTIDLDNRIERYYQRFYLNIDRLKFDRWLVSKVPESVDLALGCTFKTCSGESDYVNISFSYNGKSYSEKARLIVGADGGNSMVRRIFFPDRKTPSIYIAIQEWFETENTEPYYAAVFDKTITDFYSWMITKGKTLIIGSALKKDNLALDRYKMLKMRLRDYGVVYGKKIKREGAFIYRPEDLSTIYTGDETCALTGEAAGFISPSSAEGISYAMKSSYCLAEALNDGMEGFQRRYKNLVSDIKRSIAVKNMKCPAMYSPVLRSLVLKSGIKSTEII